MICIAKTDPKPDCLFDEQPHTHEDPAADIAELIREQNEIQNIIETWRLQEKLREDCR